MTWNYRIVRMQMDMGNGKSEPMLGVHEAYYGDDGEVESITEEPITLVGEDEGVLLETLNMMIDALGKEVLNYEDF